MRCTHCEKCCERTEMWLSRADVARLERLGYGKEEFSRIGADGIRRLRNVGRFCFFYDRERKRCREYANRPRGCAIYPVNLTEDGEVIIDDLCPQGGTLTRREIVNKGRRIRLLVDTILDESGAA